MGRQNAESKYPTTTDFAERLRELRRQKDLSQTDLGERVGVHFTHISR